MNEALIFVPYFLNISVRTYFCKNVSNQGHQR